MTLCNERFAGGADWTKGYITRRTVAPDATKMNEEVLERWKDNVVFFF